MTIFLDCDGVLADFDRAAEAILGMPVGKWEARFGPNSFWGELEAAPDFYVSLPLMPDARQLFDGVAHLNPVILTGCPRGEWAQPQKRSWAARHFPGIEVICCASAEKSQFAKSGDVLVDDRTHYRDRWLSVGGVFIHHTSAARSLSEIKALVEEKARQAFPRRHNTSLWCPAEKAIQDAVDAVERMPADVRLTEAVILLGQARDKVADYVDGVDPTK